MAGEQAPKTVLVLGGTGYLGQFLVQDLVRSHKVGIVHHSTAAPAVTGPDVHHFWVDLATGEGLHEALETLGPVDVVINCAAISSPAACEKHPGHARAINVPAKLLDALDIHKLDHEGADPLLIHFSTDQVYDGSRAGWREDDPCHPVNQYGQTKQAAELLIQERWPNHLLLRSSIIYGPQAPCPVLRTLFLQFVERALRSRRPTRFFQDEFRSPVFVRDIAALVRLLVAGPQPLQHRLFNLGGPERLSRVDMAQAVAAAWGLPTDAIEAVPAASVEREVASPADISMDSSRLAAQFPALRPRAFAEALAAMQAERQQQPPPEQQPPLSPSPQPR